jgi:hypothetical protein
MSKIRPIAFSVLFALLAALLWPVEAKKISIDSFAMFQKGQFNATLLDHLGRLQIGPATTTLTGPTKEFYLSLDVSDTGEILLGCGHGAEVFRMARNGEKPVSIFKSEEPDVHAVLLHKSGVAIVATAPMGKVYSINAKGESTVLFDPTERYIWDILEDQDGSIIVAVGGSGGVYRVTMGGKVSKLFDTEDAHITTLHRAPNNLIYAGSGEKGIVYIIDQNKTRVLYDSIYKEIRGITSDSRSHIYFAAAHYDNEKGKATDTELPLPKTAAKGSGSQGQRSVVYQFLPNGNIEEIFTLKDESIHDIAYDQENQQLLVATGNSGRVFSVKPNGEFAIRTESSAAQVYRICTKGPGVTMITNNSAGILVLDDVSSSSGTYVSDLFDLGIQSRIGRLYWQDQKPQGASVSVTVRAGNSEKPDGTWTDWLPPFLQGTGAATKLSGYRFVQFKVILTAAGSGKTPYLEQIKLYYLQNNLSPRLTGVDVTVRSSGPEDLPLKGNTAPPLIREPAPRELIVSWSCQDPNEDPLTYSLLLRPAGSDQWFPFKSKLTQKSHTIPLGLFQDGLYQIKVIASDEAANPANLARTSETVSTLFTIDSTPPDITRFQTGDPIRFTVEDSTSAIKHTQYSWNGETWFPLFPDDAINDSTVETYTIQATTSSRLLFIRIEDECGNSKVFQKDIK